MNKQLNSYKTRLHTYRIKRAILILLVASAAILALCIGNTNYSPLYVIKVLLKIESKGSFTINTLRLPRMLAGLAAGFALGMAGYIFQTLLRNPLASPDVIGVSAGTSTAAVFSILVLGFQGPFVSVIAIAIGLAIAFTIYFLSKVHGHFSHIKMILIGIGFQAMLTAMTNYLLTRSAEFDVASTLQWLSGSLNGIMMDNIPWYLFSILTLFLILLMLNPNLELIILGDELSKSLGMQLNKVFNLFIIIGVLLVALTTAITGPIASVAFLSGPIAVRIFHNNRSNLVTAGLIGSFIVLSADLLANNVFSVHYPVGVITGILGAPYLILLLITISKGRK
ncbi:MAG: iron ABC transporter permease [Sphaerochaetaceae bacterium]|nr:iron ABC transporter permease [Sphaerochaetaceae bacterium]